MAATLATLRKYMRAEVNDPAPLRKLSTLTLTHDGGASETDFFQDASYDFVAQGVMVAPLRLSVGSRTLVGLRTTTSSW